MRLTNEHQELRRTTEKFVLYEINPFVEEWENAGIFPAKELFRKMGRLGLLGISKPEKFGGMGLDYSYQIVFAEEMGGAHCGGVPMGVGVQTDMATPALARFGSDELRQEFLAPAISGDMVAAIGVSEPGAGSDVASIKTKAVKRVMTTLLMVAKCGSPIPHNLTLSVYWLIHQMVLHIAINP